MKYIVIFLSLLAVYPAMAEQSPPALIDLQKVGSHEQAATTLIQELLEDHNAMAQELFRLRAENAKLKDDAAKGKTTPDAMGAKPPSDQPSGIIGK